MSKLFSGLGEIAQVVKRSRQTVQVWIRERGLPAFQVDGKGPYYLLESDLEKWLKCEKGGECGK